MHHSPPSCIRFPWLKPSLTSIANYLSSWHTFLPWVSALFSQLVLQFLWAWKPVILLGLSFNSSLSASPHLFPAGSFSCCRGPCLRKLPPSILICRKPNHLFRQPECADTCLTFTSHHLLPDAVTSFCLEFSEEHNVLIAFRILTFAVLSVVSVTEKIFLKVLLIQMQNNLLTN